MNAKNKNLSFLALDFETANPKRYSACAVGLVKVKNNVIISKEKYLIQPPDSYFHWRNIKVHHITWDDVKSQPKFKKVWKLIVPHIEEVDFLVAHSAAFDKSVINQSCELYKIKNPSKRFLCTVSISKKFWNLHPANLKTVCDYLNIKLRNHHDPLVDALACAKIMIKALKAGYRYE